MKLLPLIMAASLSAFSMPSAVAVTTMVASASGSSNYGLHAGSFQNGDFFVQACCGEPNVGDAQEEWTAWSFNFSNDPNFSVFASANTLTLATLHLVYRTGGDTPGDDVIFGAIPQAAPFSFAAKFSTYDITLDLLALGGGSSLLAAVKSGPVRFSVGNDSSPYLAVLTVQAVPEPTSWSMLITGMALLAFGARLRRGPPPPST